MSATISGFSTAKCPEFGWIKMIIIIILIVGVVSGLRYCNHVVNEPTVVYGPLKVVKEMGFSLKPGEKAVFETCLKPGGELFPFTAKYVQFSERSNLYGTTNGPMGLYGADRLVGFDLKPRNNEQIPGSGGGRNDEVNFIHFLNNGPDTVSGSVQLWGYEITQTPPVVK